jgi:hypothetical protein
MNATDLVATLDRNIVTTVSGAAINNVEKVLSDGTFTPTVYGSTGAGAGTYTSQAGSYHFIDATHCEVFIYLDWTAHTGTGNTLFTLPFKVASTNQSVGSLRLENFTYGAGIPILRILPNYMQLYLQTSGAAFSAIALDTSATVAINITYVVALDI